MWIQVNGEACEVPDGLTVAALLEHLELPRTRVAVEVNLEIVPKARHAEHEVQPGSAIEIVSFVGGG